MSTVSIPPAPRDHPIAEILAELNRAEPYTMEEFHAAYRELCKKHDGDSAFEVLTDDIAIFVRRKGWLKRVGARQWRVHVPPCR